MSQGREYKKTRLDQRVLVLIDNTWYWLMYEHLQNDYIFVKQTDKGLQKLVQTRSPQTAKLEHFNDSLYSKDFGQISQIRCFHTSSYALNFLQGTGKANYTKIEVDMPKRVTLKDIYKVFGEDCILEF